MTRLLLVLTPQRRHIRTSEIAISNAKLGAVDSAAAAAAAAVAAAAAMS